MDINVYETILDKYCPDGFWFDGFSFETPVGLVKKERRDFDFAAFSDRKVIFFAVLPEEASEAELVAYLRASLNCMVNKLTLSVNSFVVCGVTRDRFYFFNKFNDRLYRFDKTNEDGLRQLLELIDNEMAHGAVVFDYDAMKEMTNTLAFSAGFKPAEGERSNVQVYPDGSAYVYKHGVWSEASEINTESFYLLTVFTGVLGGHLFYQKKIGKAILYCLTFGLGGVGWLFDSLEILIGTYKDADGRYLLPLQNKATGFLFLLAGAAVSCGLCFVLFFVWKFLLSTFSDVLTGLF